jgi:hypothetical protein
MSLRVKAIRRAAIDDIMQAMEARGAPQDPIPVFGSWRRIYAAVIVWALVVMGLIALFSAVHY